MRFRTFAFVVGLTMATTTLAQSSGEIAYVHVNRVKSGMTTQYETARKRHWVWHQKLQDKWSFHVWQIVSGEASGTYMVCSFGHTWKEVDESDQLVGGEEDDPAAKVEPYLDAEPESYYRYLPNLSIAPKEGFSPSAKVEVTRWLVKQEDVESFLAAQAKMKDALAKTGHFGMLLALATTDRHQSFDADQLFIKEQASRLLREQPTAGCLLLGDLFRASLNPIGDEILNTLILAMRPEDALQFAGEQQQFLPGLFRANANLATSAQLWRVARDRKRELFESIAAQPSLEPEVVRGIIDALLDSNSDAFIGRAFTQWGTVAVLQTLDWIEAHGGPLTESCRAALTSHVPDVMTWVGTEREKSTAMLAALAHVVAPHASQIARHDSRVWLHALHALRKNHRGDEENYMCAFVLALALCNAPPAPLDLVSESFERVHRLAEKELLRDDAWLILQPLVPELSWRKNWDKCERLRRAPAQILNLKVCDLAMGSAAFLVEACRQLGDALSKAWHSHGEVPSIPLDEDEALYAQRLIAQRCLYGLDKNQMAADLAKLSLWLATLAKDHPFTFLDHSLRHGDALVGLTRKQIASFSWAPAEQKSFLEEEIRKRINRATQYRRRILDARDNVSYAQLSEELSSADEALNLARMVGDAAIAAFFSGDRPKKREEVRRGMQSLVEADLKKDGFISVDGELDSAIKTLRTGIKGIVPFHWELEFPEVFATDEHGNVVGGFDAIVGNPPFAGKNTLSDGNADGYLDWLKQLHEGSHGNSDLVAHFFRRTFTLLRSNGCFGLIATNTIGQGCTKRQRLRL